MLSENYKPQISEKKWQENWQKSEIYKWDSTLDRSKTFVIDTPPPTVSGMLHMGHVFSYTQADFIARFQRMIGKTVFYPIGFDDNGLPTERLVEKINGVKASSLTKEQFNQMCQVVIRDAELEFRTLFEALALSFDWNETYQTVSDSTAKLSQMSFLDLYNKGLLIKKYAPTFWDPVDKTAIAQTEIEDKEKSALFSEIVFSKESGGEILIAMTRPELLPACVAVFYHPEDSRFQNLEGANAIVPIFDFTVPFIADSEVDMEKGSGLVMCCTFGDIQDVRWYQRYNLEVKTCISKTGYMQNAGILDGMTVSAARAKILELLAERNLIRSQVEIKHSVKCAERSGAALEIILTNQWYISILDYKKELLDKTNLCNWHPSYMRVRLENWINGLNQDWCISRQRYFGINFPVWYSKRSGEEGKVLFPDIEQLPVDPSIDLPVGYRRDEVIAETDIMDTWATSALTPQISSKAITKDYAVDYKRHKKLYPADLRIQAHEIIRTWAFCTIVKSHHHENSIPWKNVMISGWCLAKDGQKMSKSKGNIVTPQELIVEKSADAVRYWASCSKLGADIAYSEEAFKIGKKLITKLWNASKFFALHFSSFSNFDNKVTATSALQSEIINCDLDLWILSKLQRVVHEATKAFESFEYSEARQVAEEFFWKDFCDNYVELVKVRIYDSANKDEVGKRSAVYTMYFCIYTMLRLFAPFIPHITEELNAQLFPYSGSVHAQKSWPMLDDYVFFSDKLDDGEKVLKLLELVRKAKSLANIALNHKVSVLKIFGPKISDSLLQDLKNATHAGVVEMLQVARSDMIMSDCANFGVSISTYTKEVAAYA